MYTSLCDIAAWTCMQVPYLNVTCMHDEQMYINAVYNDLPKIA